MSNRKGDWMQTYTGKKFWPLDPNPKEVDIEDIAHALSLLCRFSGHCNEFYSVAQHSVLVSTIVNPEEELPALLHDATEAYLGDIIKPIKEHLPYIKDLEKVIGNVISEHFNISKYRPEEIKRADRIALYTEMRDIMGEPPEKWGEYEKYQPLLLQQKIIPITSKKAEQLFLKRYEEVNKQIF